ncbi:palmitoyltransferase [Anaeramoeba flamelloides]|uniref:Palmitoyltransferase n=1 Tax=Anaeramoeba flamelloides TaxID=1746091 RepID=A0AAV7YAY9_9EUKA|nr:palmitoyltransferase [Anaeramoeba flamelloides]KAJ6237096.1 palmitoyltransferase [Anaeramoeba flamelloides]
MEFSQDDFENEVIKEEDLDYEIMDRKLEGGFGEVKFARWKGQRVAVKSVPKDATGPQIEALKLEIALMSKLNNQNVARIYGKVEGTDTIVMHCYDHGSLEDLVHKGKETIPLAKKLEISAGIANGLCYLHSLKILHRDVKPDNVLIFEKDGRSIPILIDFGISIELKSDELLNQTIGTLPYMAPEMFKQKYSYPVDVYAFGITLWELFAEEVPLDGMDEGLIRMLLSMQKKYKKKFLENNPDLNLPKTFDFETLRPTLPSSEKVPQQILDVIGQCWHSDPKKRPFFSDLVSLFNEWTIGVKLNGEDYFKKKEKINEPVNKGLVLKRVLHVGSDQEFEKIHLAIESAEHDDVILVHPGEYRETLKIRKNNITIVGLSSSEGDVEIVSKSDAALSFQASTGTFRNIKFKYLGSNHAAVSINGGKPKFDRCEFSSTGPYCMCVTQGGNPYLNGCIIFEGIVGIIFSNRGEGTLNGCNIFNNKLQGVWITSGKVKIVDCNIYSNNEGVFVDGVQSMANLQNSNIFKNQNDGIRIENGLIHVSGCEISRNLMSGIKALNIEYGEEEFKDDENEEEEEEEEEKKDVKQIRFIENRVYGNKNCGYYFQDVASVLIEKNIIEEQKTGIYVFGSQKNIKSFIKINECEIKNLNYGIELLDSITSLQCNGSNIRSCIKAGIKVEAGKLSIKSCEISDGMKQSNGIICNPKGIVVLSESSIYNNPTNGVAILGKCKATKLKVFQNGKNGFGVFKDTAELYVINCIITSNKSSGVYIDKGKLDMNTSKIQENLTHGIDIRNSLLTKNKQAKIFIKKNIISKNRGTGIRVTNSNFIIEQNRIFNNNADGCHIKDESKGNVINNLLTENSPKDISVINNSHIKLSGKQLNKTIKNCLNGGKITQVN